MHVLALRRDAQRRALDRRGVDFEGSPDFWLEVGNVFDSSAGSTFDQGLTQLPDDVGDIDRESSRLFEQLTMESNDRFRVLVCSDAAVVGSLHQIVRQAVVVYQLRATMASCPAIGVVGTVRTGKSTLLKKAFPSDTAHSSPAWVFNTERCCRRWCGWVGTARCSSTSRGRKRSCWCGGWPTTVSASCRVL